LKSDKTLVGKGPLAMPWTGKAMLVCIDKLTCGKMHGLSSHSFAVFSTGCCSVDGLYEKKGQSIITAEQLRRKPEHRELLKYAHDDSGPERLWFDLVLTQVYAKWKGRLIISWPGPAIVWSRWANNNHFPVDAILDESVFSGALQNWRELVFSWSDLHVIPQRWKDVLSRWRGVYYIWDSRDRRGYGGSSTGSQGLYQRWIDYAKRGHGGNKLLKLRKPKTFQFSILEWAAPDMEDCEILERERMWKERLHSRAPHGLNDN